MEQKYKNRKYAITVQFLLDALGVVPVGAPGNGSVNIVNLPFILKKITHAIVGENHLDAAFPNSAIQDGQYMIEWRTDQHNYESEPLHSSAYGTEFDHFDLETPEELPPKTTITVHLTNNVQRLDSTQVQLVFHGLEPIEDVKPS